MSNENLLDPLSRAGPLGARSAHAVPEERSAAQSPAPVVAPAPLPGPPSDTRPATPAPPSPRSLAELAAALRKVNLTFDLFEIAAQIEVTDSGEVIVRIVNQHTGELIRQIPADVAQELFANGLPSQGLLTDRRI